MKATKKNAKMVTNVAKVYEFRTDVPGTVIHAEMHDGKLYFCLVVNGEMGNCRRIEMVGVNPTVAMMVDAINSCL